MPEPSSVGRLRENVPGLKPLFFGRLFARLKPHASTCKPSRIRTHTRSRCGNSRRKQRRRRASCHAGLRPESFPAKRCVLVKSAGARAWLRRGAASSAPTGESFCRKRCGELFWMERGWRAMREWVAGGCYATARCDGKLGAPAFSGAVPRLRCGASRGRSEQRPYNQMRR